MSEQMKIKTMVEFQNEMGFKGKRVLLRADYNVPIDKQGNITSDSRIRESLPTIKYLLEHDAKLIIATHFGRPDGRIVEELRVDKIAEQLSKLVGKKVMKLNDSIGDEVEKAVAEMKEGEIIMLENIRFHTEEEKNDAAFAKKLSRLANVFVMDAFGACHRAHASTEGITGFLPSYAGFLVEKEVSVMSKLLEKPEKPFMLILGGSKISDKIEVIKNLIGKANCLLIGGAMMFTFYKAKGLETGKSLVELDKVDAAKGLLKKSSKKIILPIDTVAADKIENNAISKDIDVKKIPKELIGLDIGPKTIELFAKKLVDAKTVLWNGPLGMYEIEKFARGTEEIAKIVSGLNATTVICGGDTAVVFEKLGLQQKITHLSTGGGASLEFLSGKELPGLKALMK